MGGNISLYIGHFDIPWSQSIQMLSKLLFHLASISLKIEIFEKMNTKYSEILCKKSVLLSCLVILYLGLKLEHS